jgi:hypothetical protein
MSSAADRSNTDLNLDQVIDLFDTAITSKDPRVVDALRSLLVIAALTAPADPEKLGDIGPFRHMERQLDTMHNRVRSLEDTVQAIIQRVTDRDPRYNPYSQDAYNHNSSGWRTWPTMSQSSYVDTTKLGEYINKINGGPI